MNRIVQLVILSIAVVIATPLFASAQSLTISSRVPAPAPAPTPTRKVPELDASAAGAALALLAGGALLINARRRRLAH